MKRLKGSRPSPAMVVAIVALVAALGGGAYAATVAKNSVGAKQLKKNAVVTKKIKNNAVTEAKIADGAISQAKLAQGTANRWAYVNGSTGAIFSSSSGVTAERVGVGLYFVRFGSSVQNRAILAQATQEVAIVEASRCGGGPGDLNSCSPASNNTDSTVFVDIDDADGNPEDASFMIAALP